MKHIFIALFGTLVFLAAVFAIPPGKTFRGEIMDSQCAKAGSHDVMKSKEGARDVAECTRDCVKMGGKYVLYDAATGTVYQLDDQKRLEPLAGQRVKVVGVLEAKTIYVTSIQPLS